VSILLIVLFALILKVGGSELSPHDKPIASCEFVHLTRAEADRLDGQTVQFQVEMSSAEDEHNGYILYDCKSRNAVARTAWFLPNADGSDLETDDGSFEVEGRLVVIVHPDRLVGATWFDGFMEFRLMNVRRVW
jgi:hypothetical protein